MREPYLLKANGLATCIAARTFYAATQPKVSSCSRQASASGEDLAQVVERAAELGTIAAGFSVKADTPYEFHACTNELSP